MVEGHSAAFSSIRRSVKKDGSWIQETGNEHFASPAVVKAGPRTRTCGTVPLLLVFDEMSVEGVDRFILSWRMSVCSSMGGYRLAWSSPLGRCLICCLGHYNSVVWTGMLRAVHLKGSPIAKMKSSSILSDLDVHAITLRNDRHQPAYIHTRHIPHKQEKTPSLSPGKDQINRVDGR